MSEQIESAAGNQTNGGAKCCPGGGRIKMLTLGWALAMSGLLAFAAFAKFSAARPHEEMFDYTVGGVQVVIIVGLLALWRKWWTWAGLAVMWSGMSAWCFYASANGKSCGCFAALIEVPPYTSGVLDGMLALVSLSLAFVRGAPAILVVATAFGMAVAAPTGWKVAEQFVDPSMKVQILEGLEGGRRPGPQEGTEDTQPEATGASNEGAVDDQQVAPAEEPVASSGIMPPSFPENPGWSPARQRWLDSDLLADVREQEFGGPAWLIFNYDPECHICEEIMPYMDFMGEDWELSSDPVLQIRKFSIPDMVEETGIERYQWPNTPTMFVVRDGEIVAQWYGETVEGWTDAEIQEIYDALDYDDPNLFPAEMDWDEEEGK